MIRQPQRSVKHTGTVIALVIFVVGLLTIIFTEAYALSSVLLVAFLIPLLVLLIYPTISKERSSKKHRGSEFSYDNQGVIKIVRESNDELLAKVTDEQIIQLLDDWSEYINVTAQSSPKSSIGPEEFAQNYAALPASQVEKVLAAELRYLQYNGVAH